MMRPTFMPVVIVTAAALAAFLRTALTMRRPGRYLLLVSVLGFATPAFGQPSVAAEAPLTNHELLHKYVWATLGPSGAMRATVASAFDQWRDVPRAWSRDKDGYVERWASEYAATAIGSTTKYGVARLLHQDPSFVRCGCEGVAPRLGHALLAPFKARTGDGEWTFSPATVAGLAAENVIPAATWYPAARGVHSGAAHALTGVLSKMAVDVVHEFVPGRFKRLL
jgi:hypothetical protein